MQIGLNINPLAEIDPQEKKSLKSLCRVKKCNYLTALAAVVVFTIILYVCKAYTNLILRWLEKQDTIIIYLVILILFIVVSFPITVGYIVIVIATGYLFGLATGLMLCVFGANLGLLIAHNVLKVISHNMLRSLITSETAITIFKVIAGPASFRIILCARLTPIPFGLQNTIFAISNIGGRIYFCASGIGLLPGQIVGVYVGTSLRSMQDVLDNREISTLTYLLAAAQLLLALGLLVWLGTKARRELARAITAADNNKSVFNIV